MKKCLDILIPDRSMKLQAKIKREHFLVKKMMLDAESKANLAEDAMSLYLEHGVWHVMADKGLRNIQNSLFHLDKLLFR